MTKAKIETVKVKVPKRLEKDIESFNRRSNKDKKLSQKPKQKQNKPRKETSGGIPLNRSIKRSFDKIHNVNIGKDSMRISGSALIDIITTSVLFPATSGESDCYLVSRKFVHPSVILSRRLKNFSNNYSKYKFSRFQLYFVGAKSATEQTYLTTAFTKDFNVQSPFPGVSLKSYMSELHDEVDMKSFDEGPMSKMDIIKDAKSFNLTLGVGDIEDTFQAQYLAALTGAAADTYYGDLHVDYEIEFSNESVVPVNLTYRTSFSAFATAATSTWDTKVLRWTTSDTGQIDFWSKIQGVYICELARSSWSQFDNTDFVGRNYYGTGFVLSVQGIVTSGVFNAYSEIQFTVYPNYAAMLDGNPTDYTGTLTKDHLNFVGQMVADTDPLVVSGDQIVHDVVHEQGQAKPLTIGIGVGPGVFAGEPDVVPSIGINHGRLVFPSPIKRL